MLAKTDSNADMYLTDDKAGDWKNHRVEPLSNISALHRLDPFANDPEKPENARFRVGDWVTLRVPNAQEGQVLEFNVLGNPKIAFPGQKPRFWDAMMVEKSISQTVYEKGAHIIIKQGAHKGKHGKVKTFLNNGMACVELETGENIMFHPTFMKSDPNYKWLPKHKRDSKYSQSNQSTPQKSKPHIVLFKPAPRNVNFPFKNDPWLGIMRIKIIELRNAKGEPSHVNCNLKWQSIKKKGNSWSVNNESEQKSTKIIDRGNPAVWKQVLAFKRFTHQDASCVLQVLGYRTIGKKVIGSCEFPLPQTPNKAVRATLDVETSKGSNKGTLVVESIFIAHKKASQGIGGREVFETVN